jgi:ribonuclease Z
MDHWSGFDHLLRLSLGRKKEIRLFGPPGIAAQVGHKLHAYTWNLLETYANDLALSVTEVGEAGPESLTSYRVRAGFAPEPGPSPKPGPILHEGGNLRISAAVLDHGIPCLPFAIEEEARANVRKNLLEELGLGAGPWLRELKSLALRDAPADTPVTARWRDSADSAQERAITLGFLKERVLTVSEGRKLAYVTDIAWTARNVARAVELARNAETLFVEATFLDRDRERAAARRHLTALQAGTLARLAAARRVVPFHFSPRHADEEGAIRAEVEAGFSGEASAALPPQ